ncbi:hypothetical protein O9992_22685 [Vibrio lentus]|nr:hypothetical protein [Vibrio lentus]
MKHPFKLDNALAHKQLNGQKPIGSSRAQPSKCWTNQVVYHRDYLDVGSMLYEQYPSTLGCAIKSIKKRASR